MIPVIFDLDDVVYQTRNYTVEKLVEILKHKPVSREISVIKAAVVMCGGTMGAERWLKANDPAAHKLMTSFMYGEVLKHGDFILEVIPCPDITSLIVDLHMAGVPMGVCTHRKSIENGTAYTEEVLERDFKGFFESVHILDSKDHPDKTEYLDSLIGDYYLVDDNPFHHEIKEPNPKVIVWTKHNRLPSYENQLKIKDIDELKGTLFDLLKIKQEDK